MIHRTFRSLDQAPKLVGFTIRQWACLLAGSGLVIVVVLSAHLPARPAITLAVFLVGLPAALTYVSESGGLDLGRLLGDMWRWRWRSHRLAGASRARDGGRGIVVLGAREAQISSPPDDPVPDAGVADRDYWERWG